MRDSVIVYASFIEAIRELEPDDQLTMFWAICDYGTRGIEPQLDGSKRLLWHIIKPLIDANNKRYEDGKKGGRPRKKAEETSCKTSGLTSGFEKKNQW